MYSIDTSAILDGWRRYYPPDVFPGLWEKLELLVAGGELIASEEVLVELERRDDEVHDWAKNQVASMFVPIDDDIQAIVADILRDHKKLIDTRPGRSAADPFVIALALLRGCPVVTGERPTGRPNRPNIPDVCGDLGVESVSLLDLIRQQGWSFPS